MALFDDRKKGQENKYAHDQEMRFKIAARRNKLLGLWLAEMFGLTGEAAMPQTCAPGGAGRQLSSG